MAGVLPAGTEIQERMVAVSALLEGGRRGGFRKRGRVASVRDAGGWTDTQTENRPTGTQTEKLLGRQRMG